MRTPLTPLALATVVAALLATPTPAVAATQDIVGWTVETADNDLGSGRGNFTYEVAPGDVIEDSMIVVNTGTVELPLDVYAADAFTTAGGDIDVLLDATPSEGAGTWVSIDTPTLTLEPGARAEVDFTITVPENARPGDHAAGIVTSLVTSDASQALAVDRRLGTRINARVAGALVPGATVEQVEATYQPSWNPFDAGTVTVTYALQNTGNTRITAVENLRVAGPFDLLAVDAGAVRLPEVIPGSTIEVQRQVPVTSVGWVNGALVVRPEGIGLGAGDVAPVTVEVAIVALPWSLYALVAAILIAVAALVTVILRRRKRDTIDPAAIA